MDISSLYRTPAREKKALIKLQMAAYTVRNNQKPSHSFFTLFLSNPCQKCASFLHFTNLEKKISKKEKRSSALI